MTEPTSNAPSTPFEGADWLDPLEERGRQSIRGFIEQLVESELEAFLGRQRYGRGGPVAGHRHGHRERQLLGTFGPTTVSLPRARVQGPEGPTREWRSQALRAYKRLTQRAEALIAGVYLAGTNTRRVRRALQGLFAGAVGKDTVIRAWHRVQSKWQAWQKRDLAGDQIVRLILDGTVVKVRIDRVRIDRVRIDRQATALSILVAMGVRQDGQKVILAIRSMGGESEAAWRAVLDDLVTRG